jgi:hypothetical protein
MIPERIELLWKVMDAHAEMVKLSQELESECGDGPAGRNAKLHLQADRDKARRLVYSILYGCEPPDNLPDNWEAS